MSQIKDGFYYSKEHEWVQILDENTVRIGISDYAQEQLGEIVFIELPEVGAQVQAGDSVGSVESVKAVSDLYSPVTGTVVQVNSLLENSPQTVNESPFDEGWMFEIKLDDPGQLKELLNAEQYKELIEGDGI